MYAWYMQQYKFLVGIKVYYNLFCVVKTATEIIHQNVLYPSIYQRLFRKEYRNKSFALANIYFISLL